MAITGSSRPTGDPKGMSLLELAHSPLAFAYLIKAYSRFGKIGLRVIPY